MEKNILEAILSDRTLKGLAFQSLGLEEVVNFQVVLR